MLLSKVRSIEGVLGLAIAIKEVPIPDVAIENADKPASQSDPGKSDLLGHLVCAAIIQA